jgi:hypothetical protein
MAHTRRYHIHLLKHVLRLLWCYVVPSSALLQPPDVSRHLYCTARTHVPVAWISTVQSYVREIHHALSFHRHFVLLPCHILSLMINNVACHYLSNEDGGIKCLQT